MPSNLIDNTQLVRLLAVDERTLKCPLCDHTEDSPPIPVSDQLGAVFGLTGDTLARIHGDQQIKRICAAMRRHLDSHPVEEWLLAVIGTRQALELLKKAAQGHAATCSDLQEAGA